MPPIGTPFVPYVGCAMLGGGEPRHDREYSFQHPRTKHIRAAHLVLGHLQP